MRPNSVAISSEEIHLRVLRFLQKNPHMTQRGLAVELGVSLGRTNYCIRALLERGLIKLQNFQNSRHKLAYSYFLTPAGLAEKSAITARFLKRKLIEYEQLQCEISLLQSEISETEMKNTATSSTPQIGVN